MYVDVVTSRSAARARTTSSSVGRVARYSAAAWARWARASRTRSPRMTSATSMARTRCGLRDVHGPAGSEQALECRDIVRHEPVSARRLAEVHRRGRIVKGDRRPGRDSLRRLLHRTIRKVTGDMQALRFNHRDRRPDRAEQRDERRLAAPRSGRAVPETPGPDRPAPVRECGGRCSGRRWQQSIYPRVGRRMTNSLRRGGNRDSGADQRKGRARITLPGRSGPIRILPCRPGHGRRAGTEVPGRKTVRKSSASGTDGHIVAT